MKLHKYIHFVGIGGISMSALAMIMLKKGCKVSGSDCTESYLTQKLKEMGAKIFIGHSEENIKDPDLVVYTAAISKDNPELLTASTSNIECLERADFLGELITDFTCPIAISGTHGKTTTTSMISCIFLQAELDPTILVGGTLDKIGGNVQIGSGDHLIFEACEYKDSFLKFDPKIALILNLEADHLDYFSGIEQIKDSFLQFINKIPENGFVVINQDDKNVVETARKANCKKVTYGMTESDYTARNIHYSAIGKPIFDAYHNEDFLGTIHLNIVGDHNVSNAIGAFALAHTVGIEPVQIIKGLQCFAGTGRRFEHIATVKGISLYDDYAHHPTEIAATLAAANDIPHNKIWCVFQPHTYSRTKAFLSDFASALSNVDYPILTDIYAAREKKDPTISAKDIVDKMPNATYISSFDEIADTIAKDAKEGDIIFTMGAGDVYKIGNLILERL